MAQRTGQNQNDTKNISRRDVLKNVGIAATGVAGITGVSTASTEEQEEAQNATHSQILLDALNNPTVRDAVTVDSEWATATILYTDIGRLIYVNVDGGEKGAQFQVEAPANYRKPPHNSAQSSYSTESSLPTSGNVVKDLDHSDIPEDGKATLVVTFDGDIEYIRTASEPEQQRLEELTGLDADNSLMAYTSVIDGFEVHSLDEGSLGERSDRDTIDQRSAEAPLDPFANREVYFVRTDKTGGLQQPSVELVDPSDEISTLGGGCLDWFKRCGAEIGRAHV